MTANQAGIRQSSLGDRLVFEHLAHKARALPGLVVPCNHGPWNLLRQGCSLLRLAQRKGGPGCCCGQHLKEQCDDELRHQCVTWRACDPKSSKLGPLHLVHEKGWQDMPGWIRPPPKNFERL